VKPSSGRSKAIGRFHVAAVELALPLRVPRVAMSGWIPLRDCRRAENKSRIVGRHNPPCAGYWCARDWPAGTTHHHKYPAAKDRSNYATFNHQDYIGLGSLNRAAEGQQDAAEVATA
jgi:hypothetical protein